MGLFDETLSPSREPRDSRSFFSLETFVSPLALARSKQATRTRSTWVHLKNTRLNQSERPKSVNFKMDEKWTEINSVSTLLFVASR